MGSEKCVEAEQAADCNPGAVSVSQDEPSRASAGLLHHCG